MVDKTMKERIARLEYLVTLLIERYNDHVHEVMKKDDYGQITSIPKTGIHTK